MAAYFTYDAVNQVPVTGNTDYGPIDPGYEITMALASWNQDPANTADYCFVVLPLLSATPRPEAFQDARLWYGIDYNPADGAFTNCGEVGYEMDPKIWGPNVGDLWLYYADNYFISVGEMTQAVNDAIAASDPTLIPLAVGGQIGVAGFLSSDIPGIVDDVYGFVNPIDPAFNIDFANNVLAVDVNQGTNIAPGFYNMNSLVYWSLSL
ncbi:MAG TPA: hypothetical protein ENK18_27830 [Deltaproteobacteria bacterium]|nr:hypothetical protein [Deltaproteobacteria bacterium]